MKLISIRIDRFVSGRFAMAASAAALLLAVSAADAATNIALWSMNPTGGGNPAVLDSRTAPGQGVVTGSDGSAGATGEYLASPNGLGDAFFTTTDVPPLGMFVNGAGPGTVAYDASAIVNVDGVLAYFQDRWGDEFNFAGSFSVELFFKTDGDWTWWDEPMYLLKQAEVDYRYGLLLNDGGSGGALTFEFRSSTTTNKVNLTAKNFMDGQWHYVLATYDETSGTASLTVADQGGTTNWTTSGAVTLRPAGGDGNMLIGRNTFTLGLDNYTLFGFMDEIQISRGVVGASERIGRIPSIDGPAPAFIPSSIGAQPLPQTAVTGGFASFYVEASGSPAPTYQWRLNGANLSGATSSTLSIFPVVGTNGGNYDVVVQNLSNGVPHSVTSSAVALTVIAPHRVAQWPMNPTGGNWPAVLDTRTAAGEGIAAGWDADAGLTGDDLGVANQMNDTFVTTNLYPPIAMFINQHGAAPVSYDASVIAGMDGVLFYPEDRYGNEFSFRGAFAVEMFFKSHGDQSGAGPMQLIKGSENFSRFELSLNEASPGALRFTVSGTNGTETVELAAGNYADGSWHYLLAEYNSVSNLIRITAVRQDGAEATAATTLPPGFGPLSGGNDGNLLIGRYTYEFFADPRTFLGLLDEIQIHEGVATTANRIGRIPSLDGAIPSNVAPFITGQPVASQTVVAGSLAEFSVQAQGSAPLNHQWRRNGIAVSGATNATQTLFPLAATNAGNYDVIISNSSGSVTSSVATVTVLSPFPVALWSMAPTGSNDPVAVADSRIAPGQGLFTGPNLPQFSAEVDNLIIKGDEGIEYSTSTNVPPVSMFRPGNSPGDYSYNAEAITNLGGALFFAQDGYGNEFSSRGAFSVELFFKTRGNQSTNGQQYLVKQGEGFFRYGIVLNEAGPGSVRFAVNPRDNGFASLAVADLTGTNYADGTWHYLLAQYDPFASVIRITIVNEDGTEATAVTPVLASFGPMVGGNDGNLFVGRNLFGFSTNSGTFRGFIDEVQISAGLVPRAVRLGRVPSLDFLITSISVAGGTVTIDFTGGSADTPASFVLQGSATVNGTYGDLSATMSSLGGGNFRATIPVAGAANFYRIRRF